jgi:hypothetical protein
MSVLKGGKQAGRDLQNQLIVLDKFKGRPLGPTQFVGPSCHKVKACVEVKILPGNLSLRRKHNIQPAIISFQGTKPVIVSILISEPIY